MIASLTCDMIVITHVEQLVAEMLTLAGSKAPFIATQLNWTANDAPLPTVGDC